MSKKNSVNPCQILVATTNVGKLSEISAMLALDINWLSLSDFPGLKEIKEDAKTFTENARKKALGYAKQTGLLTLADDSGLVIDVLGGLPGITSARFSGEEEKNRQLYPPKPWRRRILDHKNMQKVLKLLKNVPEEKRTAKFVCCLCLANSEKVLIETEGKLEGIIAEKEAGTNGFGYDPIFFVPKLNKTVAQLVSSEKNAISHRGNAIRKLKPLLEKLLKTS